MDRTPLYQILDALKLDDPGKFTEPIPDHILKNLAPHIELRPYQTEALNRYFHQINKYERLDLGYINLLSNMATGSGKTVIMAALILDLYKRGYNKFVFFVNRGNIVRKTIENFTNPSSSKYLFADSINIDGKTPSIKAVESLNSIDESDIHILFTTIQKLHGDLFTPREGRITLADIADEKIVLLSDEAHHINAWTVNERLNKEEELEKTTWEHSVRSIYLQNPDNMLLEFTATIDMGNPAIAEKYNDSLLFKYDLKQFRDDKYSKDIILFSVHDDLSQRMLQALLVSQCRLKIAESYGLQLKPVILFKSKTIAESIDNQKIFSALVKNLTDQEVGTALGVDTNALTLLNKYLHENKISFNQFISELKIAFSDERIVNVNDEKEAVDLQIAINRLEDEDNRIRVVFAVEKLNEGWDVLNLFDIVRLYNTRDGQYNRGGEYRPGKTTTQEAQLIGRGARLWPFRLGRDQELDKRKYDKDLDNEVRILEELYYHSPRDTDYLIEIRTALVESGMMDKKDPATVTLRLKDSFKARPIYKGGHVYINDLENNPHADKKTVLDYLSDVRQLEIKLLTQSVTTDIVFGDEEVSRIETATKDYKFADLPRHIVNKALDKQYKFYNFTSLKSFLPKLETKDEFITMLSDVKLKLSGAKNIISDPTNLTWLKIVDNVLTQLQTIIETKDAPKVGTRQFRATLFKEIFKAEKKIIIENALGTTGVGMSEETDDALHLDLKTCEWYAYEEDFGDSYEKRLVKLIDAHIDELHGRWDDLYLVRNEQDLKLYSFADGSLFMPDYLLFLEKHGKDAQTYYVFMEPKGEQLEAGELWKQDFLLQLKSDAKIEKLLGDESEVKIIGLPFYLPIREVEFEEALLAV